LIDNRLLRRNDHASHSKSNGTTKTHCTKYNKNKEQIQTKLTKLKYPKRN